MSCIWLKANFWQELISLLIYLKGFAIFIMRWIQFGESQMLRIIQWYSGIQNRNLDINVKYDGKTLIWFQKAEFKISSCLLYYKTSWITFSKWLLYPQEKINCKGYLHKCWKETSLLRSDAAASALASYLWNILGKNW